MPIKTDRRDAEQIARLLHLGWFRPVHCKSVSEQEVRAVLSAISGGITKAGDANLRRALCHAATVMMHRGRSTWLRTWAAQGDRHRGSRRAMAALARRIGVILHRMWVEGSDVRSDSPAPNVA